MLHTHTHCANVVSHNEQTMVRVLCFCLYVLEDGNVTLNDAQDNAQNEINQTATAEIESDGIGM